MAFTAEQLAATESAIAALSAGAQEVQDAFGNRVRKPELKQLIALKRLMEEDISKTARTSGFDKFKFGTKS